MMRILVTNKLLLSIVVLGILLRFFQLGSIPASLNPDEAALGYNAYALLKTGADEHGVFFPLALQSFGDWKLPMYSYVTAVFVAVFGLTEFSVRLPSALSGVVSIVLMYILCLQLFKQKHIAYFAALFMAVSPWSIYFSRAAYEVNLATTFFLSGLTVFIYALHPKRFVLLPIAGMFFGITFFTYHSYILFLPLFLFVLGWLYRSSLLKKRESLIGLGILTFALLLSLITTSVAGTNKISTLLIFQDPNVLYNRAEKIRGDLAGKEAFHSRLLYNRYFAGSYQLAQNYLLSFSPSFLFDKGGEKLVHNLGSIGNLYLFDALLLVVGVASLFWKREKALPFLISWLILAPIPSALTKDTPNTTRLFLLLPVFVLITAYGAYTLWQVLFKKSFLRTILFVSLLLGFIVNIIFFLDLYFVHLNVQRVRFWRYGYKQAVALTKNYPEYTVVVRGPENFPYIYFLFYNQYDPKQFRKEVVYYPPTDEGFLYVKSFGRYSFQSTIEHGKLERKTFVIDDTLLNDQKQTIKLPSGEPIIGYYLVE